MPEREKPTWEQFRWHYNCEWDTDEWMGWDELKICMEQLHMLKEEESEQ